MSRALVALSALIIALGTEARAQETENATARLTVASDPADAVVSLSEPTTKPGEKVEDRAERILGRTPVTVEVPAGTTEVVIAKDGYVLKVEPLELQAGAAQRLRGRPPE